MAEIPIPELVFDGRCGACGERRVILPEPLPHVGDDFEWGARDYDAVRIAMLEELAARFPSRAHWTAADLEVVLVEVLAAALDQLADMADRVAAEAYLETARRPESVRRLLKMIGYDAVQIEGLEDDPESEPDARTAEQKLETLWIEDPILMEQARQAGPRGVHDQRRMVTAEDYRARLAEHPIVTRAAARDTWLGSWRTMRAAVILVDGWTLDRSDRYTDELRAAVEDFHRRRGIPLPEWDAQSALTHRSLLRPYVDAYRMLGQEVLLVDAERVGILIDVTILVADGYFQSEVRRAIQDALGNGPGGFFESGRLRFGEDLYASDLFEVLMRLEGVENLCLNRFKRVGDEFSDRSDEGFIVLDGLEIAVCDNDPSDPGRGLYRLNLHGGRKG